MNTKEINAKIQNVIDLVNEFRAETYTAGHLSLIKLHSRNVKYVGVIENGKVGQVELYDVDAEGVETFRGYESGVSADVTRNMMQRILNALR